MVPGLRWKDPRAAWSASLRHTPGAAAWVSRAGTPTPQHLEYAADLRSKLPEDLSSAAREPSAATALIYALLLNTDEAKRAQQLAALQHELQEKTDAEVWQQ